MSPYLSPNPLTIETLTKHLLEQVSILELQELKMVPTTLRYIISDVGQGSTLRVNRDVDTRKIQESNDLDFELLVG